jgi:hypothetical protein
MRRKFVHYRYCKAFGKPYNKTRPVLFDKVMFAGQVKNNLPPSIETKVYYRAQRRQPLVPILLCEFITIHQSLFL